MKATVVLGNPGTGKTYDLVQRINKLIRKSVEPRKIQVISHTRTAANEIRSRLDHPKVKANTIHSICYHLSNTIQAQVVTRDVLMEFSQKSGIPMRLGNVDTDASIEAGDEYMALCEFARNSMMRPSEIYKKSHRPGTVKEFEYFWNSYTKYKRSYGFVDFTDMLSMVHNMKNPSINVSHLFVDEAQDNSVLQWVVINKLMLSNVEEVTITGDPDQSLYEWSGSDPRGMEKFGEQHDAEFVHLSQSYRVPKAVYELSQGIINRVKNRVQKSYDPTDKVGKVEYCGFVDAIEIDPKETTLMLYRCHALRKNLEDYLIENNVPYETLGGMPGFMQNKYAKAIKALLSLKDNFPHSISKYDLQAIKNNCTKKALKLIKEGKLKDLAEIGWKKSLIIPINMYEYYEGVDWHSPINVKLSTIHGSKGMEADHVVIDTGMTWRTKETMEVNPDPEVRVWFVGVTRSKNKLTLVEGEMGFEI